MWRMQVALVAGVLLLLVCGLMEASVLASQVVQLPHMLLLVGSLLPLLMAVQPCWPCRAAAGGLMLLLLPGHGATVWCGVIVAAVVKDGGVMHPSGCVGAAAAAA